MYNLGVRLVNGNSPLHHKQKYRDLCKLINKLGKHIDKGRNTKKLATVTKEAFRTVGSCMSDLRRYNLQLSVDIEADAENIYRRLGNADSDKLASIKQNIREIRLILKELREYVESGSTTNLFDSLVDMVMFEIWADNHIRRRKQVLQIQSKVWEMGENAERVKLADPLADTHNADNLIHNDRRSSKPKDFVRLSPKGVAGYEIYDYV